MREGLWCKMRYYSVEERFIMVYEGLYSGVVTNAMNRVKSRWFGVERCLRQGCPLSPTLFNIIYMIGIWN